VGHLPRPAAATPTWVGEGKLTGGCVYCLLSCPCRHARPARHSPRRETAARWAVSALCPPQHGLGGAWQGQARVPHITSILARHRCRCRCRCFGVGHCALLAARCPLRCWPRRQSMTPMSATAAPPTPRQPLVVAPRAPVTIHVHPCPSLPPPPAHARHTRPLLAAGTGHLRSHLAPAAACSTSLCSSPSCLLPRRGAEIRSASIIAARHLDLTLAPGSLTSRDRRLPSTPSCTCPAQLHNQPTHPVTLSDHPLDGANVTPALAPSHTLPLPLPLPLPRPRPPLPLPLPLLTIHCSTAPPSPSFAARGGPCPPVITLLSQLSEPDHETTAAGTK
jgi:hypothetical protein